jgi:hypothetical protein
MSTTPNPLSWIRKQGHRISGWGLVALIVAAIMLLPPGTVAAQNGDASPAAADATTWHVDGQSGADGGSCGTSAAPCRTIQAAVNKAASGDTILVAGSAGGIVYTFAGANGCTNETGTNSVVCVLKKQLTLRGGYAAGNWSSSDPSQNRTIIDGQGRNRGIFVLSYNAPSATSLTLEGVTVRNGYGVGIGKRPGADAWYGFGGGMFVEYAGSIVVRNALFENNKAVGSDRSSGAGGVGAGGAMSYRNARSVTLENVTFQGNQAQGGSGAARGGSAHGGALFTFATTLTGNGLVFRDNLAQAGSSGGNGESGGRADALGGGGNFQEDSKVTLSNVQASGNRAVGGNAAVNPGGGFGGAFEGERADVTIADADMRNNTAEGGDGQNGWFGNGGAVMVIDSTLNLARVVVVGNTAQGGNGTSGKFGVPNGGGVMSSWVTDGTTARLNITNSIIAANKAIKGSGAQIEIGGGGGLWIQATTAVLDHVTVADNDIIGGIGMLGQGFFILNTGTRRGADVVIRRSLITGHNGAEGSAVEVVKSNKVTFEGGLFHGNTWDSSATYPAIAAGDRGAINGLGTMQNGDPRYQTPSAPAYDYHIKADSAARNKVSGNSQPVDFENQARNDGQSDYGADEYAPPARPPLVYSGVAFGSTSVVLNWNLDESLAGEVAKYRITNQYTPQPGAAAMVEEVIEVGLKTSHTFENMDPYVLHSFTIDALNSAGNVVATAGKVTVMPTDRRMYLSLLRR